MDIIGVDEITPTSFPIRTGPDDFEREFVEFMHSNFPHLKWKFVRTEQLLVYRPIDEDEEKMELFAWTSGHEDLCFKKAYNSMNSLIQPLDEPLKVTYHDIELRFFARQEGWNVRWIVTAEPGNVPHRFQFILTDPNGVEIECLESTSQREARKDAQIVLENAFGKELEFSVDMGWKRRQELGRIMELPPILNCRCARYGDDRGGPSPKGPAEPPELLDSP
ncbi:uncharacterized protein FOMMEDRAFT_159018 [Fomitiporia mediterranea MF3/22]|uniref:uncharacterized protein n=1 Tax=Fomitiporia mediterranea (strain MF3/22) TaxID=694068 RepID=UPI0004408A81|nr:uncharacterized protein FOMMEDRAFT_159018 [Fomitiporia mediterranea MF3/22]EJD00343.1 hypothetical protein FOMMEDRAFT_159018 [Fomitiporia mediterranea MF3/22]